MITVIIKRGKKGGGRGRGSSDGLLVQLFSQMAFGTKRPQQSPLIHDSLAGKCTKHWAYFHPHSSIQGESKRILDSLAAFHKMSTALLAQAKQQPLPCWAARCFCRATLSCCELQQQILTNLVRSQCLVKNFSISSLSPFGWARAGCS